MEIDVQHIAKLAKLRIPQEREQAVAAELAAIVEMVEKLPPLEGGTLLEPDNLMQLREDIVQPSYPREALLQNAPETAQGCFLVPQTVE